MFLGLLLLGNASCATDRGVTGGSGNLPTVITMKPYVGKLRTVDVTIGGRTRPFLLDTGGGLAIVTPVVAGEIGCTPFGRLVGFRNNGEKIDSQRCGPATLGIGSASARVDDLAVFDLMSLLKGLPEVGGLLGLPAFESKAFTFDLASNRITIETPVSFAKRVRGMKEIRVRPSRQCGGASLDLFVSIDTPKSPIWLELDSGNLGGVLLSPPAAAQLGIALPEGAHKKITLEVSGFGPVQVDAIGRDTIYDGLLNARFMEQHVFAIDLAHMRAWMAPSTPAGGSGQRNR